MIENNVKKLNELVDTINYLENNDLLDADSNFILEFLESINTTLINIVDDEAKEFKKDE